MKAIRAISIIFILMIILGGALLYYVKDKREAPPTFINNHTTSKKYIIKKASRVIESTDTLEEAMALASQNKRTIIINTYNNEWAYTDLNPFMIITETAIHDFNSFEEALQYAKINKYTEIYYKNDQNIVWKALPALKESVMLNVPLINQYPELPRGCEVTSLAMLLRHAGIEADKMTLAEQIKKDLTPYSISLENKIIYGNPYEGFVGDMYNLSKNGYGVYHGPVVELAKEYCEERAIDLTELSLEEILFFVEQGNPVWVIVNSTFSPLEDAYFEYWHTSSGIVKITKKLHAVVITGFDTSHIYINDPLHNNKNIAHNRSEFKSAWEQMGNQAMTILK